MSYFEYEITPIPHYLNTQFGNVFNNAAWNAVFWGVLLWITFHFTFVNMLDKILKSNCVPYHLRLRVINSLWSLFFFTTFIYYSKSLLTSTSNNFIINTYENGHIFGKNNVIDETVYVFISSFYIHSVIWDVFNHSSVPINLFVLTVYILQSLYFRTASKFLQLLAIFCVVQIANELCRLSLILIIKVGVIRGRLRNLLKLVIFYSTLILTLIFLTLIAPSYLFTPLLNGFWLNVKNVEIILSSITFFIWIIAETYYSPLHRFIHHWRYHNVEYPPVDCLGNFMECTMLKQRDDVVFNLKLHIIEKKERQARMIAKRKPKKSSEMLFQTFKCMVAINRKIKLKKDKKKNQNLTNIEINHEILDEAGGSKEEANEFINDEGEEN